MSALARPFEIVVWGATGFTGRLVCQHIATAYQGRVRWAIGGRDRKKLEQVKSELTKINADCNDVPILVADAHDGASMGEMLRQTHVVIAMAGPFTLHGDKVLEQCIEQGTHYCDVTGEVTWVKKSFSRFNKAAQDKGVKLVHCCGYDSIPSDLGTIMMVDYIKNQLGKKTGHVTTLVEQIKGGASGGTLASAMLVMSTAAMSELWDISCNAYYLAGLAGGKGTDTPAPIIPTWIRLANCWAAPFVMESVNGRIVHMSNALSKERYGTNFKYTEMMKAGRGWPGLAVAMATTVSILLIGIFFMVAPLRALIKLFMPVSGQGPSVQQQQTGRWKNLLLAETEEAAGQPPTLLQGTCGDKRDPGYLGTSRMILEAGLCLAQDSGKLSVSGCLASGVMTPATAMGMVLVERLRTAGMTWAVTKVGGKDLPQA